MPRFERATLKNGKSYGQVIIETRAYPVFYFFVNLFILDGKKVIKEELLFYACIISLLNNVRWCFSTIWAITLYR